MAKTARLQTVESVEEPDDIAQASRQISEKAAKEIAELQQRITHLQDTLARSDSEIQTLQQAIAERNSYVAMIAARHGEQIQKHTAAVNYASVAQGTIGEQPAYNQVMAQKELMDRMTTDLEQAEAIQQKKNADDLARLQGLHDAFTTDKQELQQCETRIQVVESVRTQSLQELGQSLFANFTKEHAGYTHKIEEARAALAQAQIEEKQFLNQSHERFTSFSEHQQKIKRLMPEDNATLRVLRSEMAYIDALLSDGRYMEQGINLPAASNYYNWRQLLCVTSDEIYVNETLGGNPRGLRNHRRELQNLVDQYIAVKR